jgi:hypothetical protein
MAERASNGHNDRPGKRPAAPPKTSNRDRAAQHSYTPQYEQSARRPRENAFHALAWLLEGATGLVEELRHNDLGLSEEFWIHFYAARREGLLAARALIDSLLAQTEREARQAADRAERRARRGDVAIDF